LGHSRDTNNKDNNIIYINLLNKYKERMKNARYFSDKIYIQSELKKEEEYQKLTESEKKEIFKEIM
jgi:hypothetical protein